MVMSYQSYPKYYLRAYLDKPDLGEFLFNPF